MCGCTRHYDCQKERVLGHRKDPRYLQAITSVCGERGEPSISSESKGFISVTCTLSKAGVPNPFEPAGKFGILTGHGRHRNKMAATKQLPRKVVPATK